MKICLVHNEYGIFSGEEAVVAAQIQLLESHGHSVCRFVRSSTEIDRKFLGQLQAFCSGIYNPFSVRSFRNFLLQHKPDIIHIHNLFPLISPAILHVCQKISIPVVMTVHNYRLICPNGLFMVNGEICEKCSGGKEYFCVFNNCEGSFSKSLGYALRNFVARKRKSYLHGIHCFAALTVFQQKKLVKEGYPIERITIIPNMSQPISEENSTTLGDYIGFIGRISPEKGVDHLLEVAATNPHIKFKAAGRYEKASELVTEAPDNFSFQGHMPYDKVSQFMLQSRLIVLCSIWYEGFPMVLVEAMLRGRPVIASRIGGIAEIVDDGITGLLYEAGNTQDLAKKINYLWDNPKLCREMGVAGRKKALQEYTPDTYYNRLIDAYQKARTISQNS
ncbi:MAG: lipopolysaccharide N-acetylglucosaminyltransferase [Desulfotalea sp.]|nr:MAG: lipopolysaccharide N-acetylglucosaminyltransferase [Desulfotalea sp.]